MVSNSEGEEDAVSNGESVDDPVGTDANDFLGRRLPEERQREM